MKYIAYFQRVNWIIYSGCKHAGCQALWELWLRLGHLKISSLFPCCYIISLTYVLKLNNGRSSQPEGTIRLYTKSSTRWMNVSHLSEHYKPVIKREFRKIIQDIANAELTINWWELLMHHKNNNVMDHVTGLGLAIWSIISLLFVISLEAQHGYPQQLFSHLLLKILLVSELCVDDV